MSDPFLIEGPAVIAFSGGRTSGMMLYKIIEAHGGKSPDDVIPVFCNTGKEHDKTLDFVRDCGVNWNVPIRWIEYQTAEVPANRWREVDYATASREGEPFEAVIRARRYLPNPVARICTIEMKIAAKLGIQFRSDRPSYAAMLSQGNLALNDESPDNIDCACTE